MNLPGQSIAAGETSKIFTVDVNGDASPEPDEGFTVNVSSVSGISVGKTQALGTIVNDDATAFANGVAAGPIAADPGYGRAVLAARCRPDTANWCSRQRAEASSQDADLYLKLGSPPSLDDATFLCASLGATTVENCTIPNPAAGTYYLLVHAYTAFSGVTLTGTYTPGRIADPLHWRRHGGRGQRRNEIRWSSRSPCRRSLASTVSFDVYTGNGTAIAGSDYVAKTTAGQQILAGQTSGNFSVTINGDDTIEGNETFTVYLANASGSVSVADGQGLGTNQQRRPRVAEHRRCHHRRR